jgi:cobalt ECF transporter T component CbiQ
MSHSIESTLHSFSRTLSRALVSEKLAAYPGVMQRLDPRARLLGMFLLLIAVVLGHSYASLLILMAFTLALAILSGIRLAVLAKRVWIVVFLFTGIIALPALVLTPGSPISPTLLGKFHITDAGLRTVILLVLRVETAVTITAVLVLCTPWNKLLRATRALGMPAELVTMFGMTHRYIFLCLETAGQMFESRKSRTVGKLETSGQRAMAAKTAAVLLMKSMDLSQDVYSAMLARGFSGEVRLIEEPRMRPTDFYALAAFAVAACFSFWIGR